MIRHLPNLLSAARGISTPFLVWCVFAGDWRIACLVFWLAVISDLVDGPIARGLGSQSDFGHRLDHSADLVFTAGGLGCLAILGFVPWVLVVLQIVAFVEYTLNANTQSGFKMSLLGRTNGVLYFVPMGWVTTQNALGWEWIPLEIVSGLGWIVAISTLISVGLRLYSRFQSDHP